MLSGTFWRYVRCVVRFKQSSKVLVLQGCATLCDGTQAAKKQGFVTLHGDKWDVFFFANFASPAVKKRSNRKGRKVQFHTVFSIVTHLLSVSGLFVSGEKFTHTH